MKNFCYTVYISTYLPHLEHTYWYNYHNYIVTHITTYTLRDSLACLLIVFTVDRLNYSNAPFISKSSSNTVQLSK